MIRVCSRTLFKQLVSFIREKGGETHLDGSCVYIIFTKLIETFQQLLNCLPNKELINKVSQNETCYNVKYETLHLRTKITQTILLFLYFNSLKKNYIQSSILSLEILGKSVAMRNYTMCCTHQFLEALQHLSVPFSKVWAVWIKRVK